MAINVTVIQSTNFDEIIHVLPEGGAHFTNGTYALAAELIVPTTLAGFAYVDSVSPNKSLPIVVAINSDVSMRAIGKEGAESQQQRAEKIKLPLAQNFPDREIYIIFYDEPTPFELYKALSKAGKTETLHKFGYGTTPEAPKIEGAEFFQTVYAFPLLNDTKPVCWDITARQAGPAPNNIQVIDLRPQAVDVPRPGVCQNLAAMVSHHRYALFAAGAAATAAAAFACTEFLSI